MDSSSTEDIAFLKQLEMIIKDRHTHPRSDSYTSRLFQKGINKIAQKVGEEAVELIIEAKDDDLDRFHEEAADLIYHLMVLLEEKNTRLGAVVDILARRHQ